MPHQKLKFAETSLIKFLIAIVFLLLFLFLAIQTLRSGGGKQVLDISDQIRRQGLPVQLRIPAINVSAIIQHIGVTPNGDMEVPSNTVDVGWFQFGARPGEIGSAVIAGHFNDRYGGSGVFSGLDKLKVGDKLYVDTYTGKSISFTVREIRMYEAGYADEVFTRNDGSYLNLITCDGTWDSIKKNYTKRLVVFSEITN